MCNAVIYKSGTCHPQTTRKNLRVGVVLVVGCVVLCSCAKVTVKMSGK